MNGPRSLMRTMVRRPVCKNFGDTIPVLTDLRRARSAGGCGRQLCVVSPNSRCQVQQQPPDWMESAWSAFKHKWYPTGLCDAAMGGYARVRASERLIDDDVVEEGPSNIGPSSDLVVRAYLCRQLWLRKSVFLGLMQRSRDRRCSGSVLASSTF
jgi:hypothetical protein